MDSLQFKQYILVHYTHMYRVALSIVKNTDEAQDITQEAVMHLWEKRARFETIENPQAFCATVVRRLCIDHFRSSPPENDNIDAQLNISEENDSNDIYESKDTLSLVMKLITTLPANQQQVLRLRSFGGCSIEEIEQITGLSNVNIRTLLSRARRQLKKLYSKCNIL